MSIKVNKETFQRLVHEDMAWLLQNCPRSLERDHIFAILEEITELKYGKDKENR